ncbi:hypothetical protein CYLTODRAFT_421179 [Cylindrobasidium torrendii FP15055 ss-10]|uniref:Uncharacterized protein n=1 Tax=Cylindrobasidium torrendii FP15055 ss-10 TaxID=1314674 RepID=A0A0D7BEI5_9AGAR|nr:hypothetical protein CYLTODRAFT_421179 [Cylindrobasidium torrendii FP15055 ss-10]
MPAISPENAYFADSALVEGTFRSTFYGFFVAVVIMSSWILINKGLTSSRARLCLFITNILMFMICTSHEILLTTFYRVQYPYLSTEASDDLTPRHTVDMLERWVIVFMALERVSYFISDSVVVWRTWCIYQDNLWIKLFLCFLTASNFATSLACGILDGARIPVNGRVKNFLGTLPLLLTNFSTTVLCAYKVWEYRRQIKTPAYGSRRKNTLIENVLLLLVESGALYCVFWILLHLADFGILSKGPFGSAFGLEWMMPHFAGIYVTLIILVVAMYQRPSDTFFTSLNIDSVPDEGEARRMKFAENSRFISARVLSRRKNTLSFSVALDNSIPSGDSSGTALTDSLRQTGSFHSEETLERDTGSEADCLARTSSEGLQRNMTATNHDSHGNF